MCVSVTERVVTLTAPGVSCREKGRNLTIHVGVLSGFWRVSEKGLVMSWGSHCTTWNCSTCTTKLSSHFPSCHWAKIFLSRSETPTKGTRRYWWLMSSHSWTSGGRNTEMEHYVSPELFELKQNRWWGGINGALVCRSKCLIIWKSPKICNPLGKDYKTISKAQNETPNHFALWFRASVKSMQFKFKILPPK